MISATCLARGLFLADWQQSVSVMDGIKNVAGSGLNCDLCKGAELFPTIVW
jgi:hypothetical protein